MRVVRLKQGNGNSQEGREYGGEETCLQISGCVNRVRYDVDDAYENEKGVNVIRKIANHVFIMSQNFGLNEVPTL